MWISSRTQGEIVSGKIECGKANRHTPQEIRIRGYQCPPVVNISVELHRRVFVFYLVHYLPRYSVTNYRVSQYARYILQFIITQSLVFGIDTKPELIPQRLTVKTSVMTFSVLLSKGNSRTPLI